MRRWCHCGAPLWPYTTDHSGCRVCYLVGLTSQQVVWDEQERVGYTAEGEAIGSVIVWSTMQEPDFDPAPFNFTDDTAATAHWLPCFWVDGVRYQRAASGYSWKSRDADGRLIAPLTTPTLP